MDGYVKYSGIRQTITMGLHLLHSVHHVYLHTMELSKKKLSFLFAAPHNIVRNEKLPSENTVYFVCSITGKKGHYATLLLEL